MNEDTPDLHIDEDWKDRVKAEDAAMDAKLQAEESQKKAEESKPDPLEDIDPSQLPAPDFSTLVAMFSTQAMVSLGIIPPPGSDKPQVNLPLAKHFIDLLGVLEDKTTGNLETNEKIMLESTLHQLRMAFVQAGKAPTSGTES